MPLKHSPETDHRVLDSVRRGLPADDRGRHRLEATNPVWSTQIACRNGATTGAPTARGRVLHRVGVGHCEDDVPV